MPYRINYNGQQVSRTFDTYNEAKQEIISQADYSARTGQGGVSSVWIQRYEGDGEWSGAGLSEKQRRPHLHRD